MTVRRFTPGGNSGYGVVGGAIGNPTEPIILSLRDICNEIPRPTTQPDSPFTPYVWQYVSLHWRFSVNIGIAEMENIKQYFAPLGRSQFGRYVISAFGYVTDEGFISYAKCKSRVYSCLVRYIDNERNDGTPCDEPQASEFFPGTDEGAFYTYSNVFTGFGATIPTEIGDGLAVWLPETVAAANVGLTYTYSITSYTADEVAALNYPNIIIT